MLILHDVAYLHPNKDLLFEHIDLTVNKKEKIALLGNNGVGKSTLMKIMAGVLQPSAGYVKAASKPYYVPQIFGQFNELTIAQALGVAAKLKALKEILNGNVTDINLEVLGEDWTIEERCAEAMRHWGMEQTELSQMMGSLSGGQKTKVFLAGIMIHEPEIVLLDEPSNHLDKEGRSILYDYIKWTQHALVVVSHDRALLNLPGMMYELDKSGIKAYGGNYDFYAEQKRVESSALDEDIKNKERTLRKARQTEREAMERQQKLDARGKKKQEKAGVPTIAMNTLRNNAEKSTSRMKEIHAGKVEGIAEDLNRLRKELPDADKMKIGFDNSALHKGKILVDAKGINIAYGQQQLWLKPMSFEIVSGERVAVTGPNGSGKTTLIKMMLGSLQPDTGSIRAAAINSIYIDQDYSLIDNGLSVYAQAQRSNYRKLEEHEVKIQLSRFLFTKNDWDKACANLSGGEKMRLALCCLSIGQTAPDLIVLDEPTNNLDIQNVELLTAAVNEYKGTVIIVSHDTHFLAEVNVGRVIEMG